MDSGLFWRFDETELTSGQTRIGAGCFCTLRALLTLCISVLLMTGTGIVPGNDFTLKSGDEISITIEGIGTLVNEVE